MAERRGFGEAIELTPDKLAFIQDGARPSASKSAAAPDISTPAEPAVVSDSETDEPTPSPSSRPKRTRNPRQTSPSQTRSAQAPVEEGGFYGQILVPLTTRLQPRTADALRRACLEQKLARRSPSSQQEIVELAVSEWLAVNGFA